MTRKLRKDRFETDAGVPIADVYGPAEAPIDFERDVGRPGEYPFTRGVQSTMYRGRL